MDRPGIPAGLTPVVIRQVSGPHCLSQVMAEADQQMMNKACKEVLPRNGKGDVLCVRGNPNMSSSLEMVCACRARAIIILADKDRDTALSSEECDANAVSR